MGNIDPRWVYLVMFVLLTIPILKPIGLALGMDPGTKNVYNWVESLQPGDIVFGDVAYASGSGAELNPQLFSWFYHCMKKGVKVIMVAQWNTGAKIGLDQCKAAAEKAKADGYSAEYGVDWVYVGYKSGGVTTWQAMQKNFWDAATGTDYYGKKFEDLPLMARVKAWDKETCKGIMIFSAGSPGIPTYTQAFIGYPLYVGNVAVQAAEVEPLVRSGQIKGNLLGMTGGAQYEMLLWGTGPTLKKMDAQSLGHLWVIVLVVLGNIAYVSKIRRKGQA